jgi:hypothetical protein
LPLFVITLGILISSCTSSSTSIEGHEWTVSWCESNFCRGEDVALDAQGNVYVAGIADGPLDGSVFSGEYDAFLVKYSA